MEHRVTMLQTVLAADHNGIHPKHYLRGRTYTVSDFLLQSFISMGAVNISGGHDEDGQDYEFNPIDQAPENRMDMPPRRKAGRPRKNPK